MAPEAALDAPEPEPLLLTGGLGVHDLPLKATGEDLGSREQGHGFIHPPCEGRRGICVRSRMPPLRIGCGENTRRDGLTARVPLEHLGSSRVNMIRMGNVKADSTNSMLWREPMPEEKTVPSAVEAPKEKGKEAPETCPQAKPLPSAPSSVTAGPEIGVLGSIVLEGFQTLKATLPDLVRNCVQAYLRNQVASRRYEFVTRLAVFFVFMGVLALVFGCYMWLISAHEEHASEYVNIVLAFLAGGGVATLLRPITSSRIFAGQKGKNDEG